MSLTIESYVAIDTDSPMNVDARPLDQEVDVVIGSSRGLSSSLRLVLSDAEACVKLAKVLTDAGALLSGGR